MDAGALDKRIVLFRPVRFEGDIEDTTALAQVAEVWAGHTPLRDAERVAAAAVGAAQTDRFLIRWAPQWADLDPTWVLDFDGARYGVDAVKPVGRREGIEITATRLAEAAQTEGDAP